jgi:hypothetical protein
VVMKLGDFVPLKPSLILRHTKDEVFKLWHSYPAKTK